MIDIQCNRLDLAFKRYQEEYEKKALEVLQSGWYVLGRECESFEEEFAGYIGCKYCIGVASGLDALRIGIYLLGIHEGDEVIVPGNTYIASAMGISLNNALPVFVEPDEYNNIDVSLIEEKITSKTKAIMAVHLYGQAADMDGVMWIARKHNLKVIEDCAQAHGAEWNGRKVGTFGEVGCFSFYPTKNLGAFGDGGAIVTNEKKIYDLAKIYRNYGSEKKYYNMMIGTNSRLDEVQAGLLRVKLKHLEELTNERRQIADYYMRNLENENIELPNVRKGASSVWHQFVVRTQYRRKLIEMLEKNGIHPMIHYPIPPHLSEAYEYLRIKKGTLPITERYADEVLSLPMYNGLLREDLDYIISKVNACRLT